MTESKAGSPAVTGQTGAVAIEADSARATSARGIRRPVAVTMAVVWLVLLGLLVVRTANPLTLNVQQLTLARQSGLVVQVTVLDAATGACRVEKVLGRSDVIPAEIDAGAELSITNLSPKQAGAGDSLVLALEPDLGDKKFEIIEVASGIAPIYPATDDVVQKISQFLTAK